MANSTDMMAPTGTTHTIKSEYRRSPLWPRIKALGNKCFYYNGTQWVDSLAENYLEYYLKFYDAVTHEGIPTETPEETEAFNKMKPYEFDEHVSGAEHKKPITRYVSVPVTVEGNNGDKIAYTTKEIAQAMAGKGGAKHDQSKPRYDLLPPVAIDELAKVLTFGAEKYAPNSWQTVPDAINRYRAALLRHTFAIQRGELIDEESGLPHSALAMCNAAFIVELEKKC